MKPYMLLKYVPNHENEENFHIYIFNVVLVAAKLKIVCNVRCILIFYMKEFHEYLVFLLWISYLVHM